MSMEHLIDFFGQLPPHYGTDEFLQSFLSERAREVTECQCKDCQEACQRTPCLGTPQDMQRLIERGHREHITWVDWCGGHEHGITSIPMLALRADFEERAAQQKTFIEFLIASEGFMGGTCPMWDRTTGLCKIHAYKPTEGKMGNCHPGKPISIRESPTLAVVFSWMLPGNRPLVRELFTQFDLRPYPYWPKEEANHVPPDPFNFDEGEHRSQ